MPLAMFSVAGIMFLITMVTDPGPSDDWITILGHASGPVLLGIIVIGAIQEWWVPGRTHRRTVAERDALLQLALHATEITGRTQDTADLIVTAAREREIRS